MEKKKSSLERKFEILRSEFQKYDSFTIEDAKSVLKEKRSTLSWTLWNLKDKGYIQRIGHGLYSFYKKEKGIKPIPSKLAQKAWNILIETGYKFFISGLDILSIFMEHVPETFPVLLFADQYSINEISEILSKDNLNVIFNVKYNYISNHFSLAEEIILLNPTQEFIYSKNGLTSFEKAFVDIYYEVTRKGYPLSIQELAKIYINMKRRISLDTIRLTKIASRRNIHHDIRFIVNRGVITKEALKLAEIIYEL